MPASAGAPRTNVEQGIEMAGIELYAPRLAKHRRTWSVAVVVLVGVFFLLGQTLSFIPIMVALKLAGIELDPANLQASLSIAMSEWPIISAVLFGCAFTALAVFLWVWLFERRGLQTIGFNGDGFKRFGRGFLIGLAFLGSAVGGIALLGGYRIETAGVWSAPSFLAFLPILVLLVGFCIQGSTEEILMRGWLMQVIASRHGIVWAMGINAVIFSLMHGMNTKPTPELALGLFNIVLVGVFFSLYALKEQSLWGVCGWHAAWNWLLSAGFGLEVSGIVIKAPPLVVDLAGAKGAPWWLTGGSFGPEGSVVATTVLLAGTICVAWQVRQTPPKSFPVVTE
jgi:uncharacterized protein